MAGRFLVVTYDGGGNWPPTIRITQTLRGALPWDSVDLHSTLIVAGPAFHAKTCPAPGFGYALGYHRLVAKESGSRCVTRCPSIQGGCIAPGCADRAAGRSRRGSQATRRAAIRIDPGPGWLPAAYVRVGAGGFQPTASQRASAYQDRGSAARTFHGEWRRVVYRAWNECPEPSRR
jgi:hypothetical protein